MQVISVYGFLYPATLINLLISSSNFLILSLGNHVICKQWDLYFFSNLDFFYLFCVFLLIFCFDDLSIGVSRVLKSPTATAKSLQSCPTLCDPIDSSPPGSPIPGILQARTLEWVAIFFSNAWKWKVKVKSLSRVQLFATPWTAAYQAPPPMGIFQARVLEWDAIAFSEVSYYYCVTANFSFYVC